MESKFVINALAALAQDSRLRIFRALVVRGHEGLTPARLAEMMGMPANTLSFHLKGLMHADLISQERSGRYSRRLPPLSGRIQRRLCNQLRHHQ